MAKQVIFQKVREAERESVYAEYHKHVGEVVNCVVKRFENGDMIVELGKTEAKLSKRDQSRLENFSVGDRIRVVITKVEKTTKGPQVMVSRTDPILVQHLFQTAPCRSKAPRVKPGSERRSPSHHVRRMSIRWAHASA